MIDLTKIALHKREDALIERLGIKRDLQGTLHQVDILEAIIKRIEALERKAKI